MHPLRIDWAFPCVQKSLDILVINGYVCFKRKDRFVVYPKYFTQ